MCQTSGKLPMAGTYKAGERKCGQSVRGRLEPSDEEDGSLRRDDLLGEALVVLVVGVLGHGVLQLGQPRHEVLPDLALLLSLLQIMHGVQ